MAERKDFRLFFNTLYKDIIFLKQNEDSNKKINNAL